MSPSESSAGPPAQTRISGLLASVGVRRVLFSLIAIIFVQQAAGPVQAWFAQRSQLVTLRAEVAAREAAVSDLKQQAARMRDPAYVEALARTRLHMVKPGERSFIIVGGKEVAAPDAPLVTSVNTSVGQPWWTTLVNQVKAGGQLPNS